MTPETRSRRSAFAPTVLLATALALGWMLPVGGPAAAVGRGNGVILRGSQTGFTRPLLACEVDPARAAFDVESLEQAMGRVSSRALEFGRAKEISVAFTDLTTGSRAGFNEDSMYTPASIVKVANLIAVLRRVDDDPALLGARVTVKEDNGYAVGVPPRDPAILGRAYRVDDLLERMIVQSDNVSAVALHQVVQMDDVLDVFRDLGVVVPVGIDKDSAFATAHQVSGLFSVLYNATYLSRRSSERAVDLLSRTDFSSALRTGVPSDVMVAHKFGERGGSDVQQFHDCGIVYHSRRPYVLCVMTRGWHEPTLMDIVSEVSRVVYTEVDLQGIAKPET